MFGTRNGSGATNDEYDPSKYAGTSVTQEPIAVELGLPDVKDRDCYSRACTKPMYALNVVQIDGGVRSFQNVHLDSDITLENLATEQKITLRFIGMKVHKVTLHGRKLRHLFELLTQHRVAWVRAADRDMGDRTEIISRIEIERVEELTGS